MSFRVTFRGKKSDFLTDSYYRASQVLARVGFLYLRFLTIQLQQAHQPTVDAHELHRVALTRHLNEILREVAF